MVSPLLFNADIDSTMKKNFQGRPGVQFGDVDFITDLMFTDDGAVFANNNADTTDILYDIASTAKPDGLTINIYKTVHKKSHDNGWFTGRCLP